MDPKIVQYFIKFETIWQKISKIVQLMMHTKQKLRSIKSSWSISDSVLALICSMQIEAVVVVLLQTFLRTVL